jgi:hypothetical protein
MWVKKRAHHSFRGAHLVRANDHAPSLRAIFLGGLVLARRMKTSGRMTSPLRLSWLWNQHWAGGLFIITFCAWVIAAQVSNRTDFASTELAHDVESRWGAPVEQAAPSLRAVESGTVFTELTPVALAQQKVEVAATMNYRKRGLTYFSGFDFTFDGTYVAENSEAHAVDVAFVFPIEVDKSQVLLSELSFEVDGAPSSMDLGEHGDRLVWTGRLPVGGRSAFRIRYRARGLESFVYRLDPSLPAKDVTLRLDVTGGDNIDYPPFVLAANAQTSTEGHASLQWNYPSLQSGVAMGVILPSVKRYDELMSTMAFRAFVPGAVFLLCLSLLSLRHRRRLSVWETYVAAAAFGFTSVLLAYLGAFVHFLAAWGVTMLGMGAAVVLFVSRLFPAERRAWLVGGWGATQVLPTLAVLLPGYTGLLYTLELLAALLAVMVLLTKREVRAFLSDQPEEVAS